MLLVPKKNLTEYDSNFSEFYLFKVADSQRTGHEVGMK